MKVTKVELTFPMKPGRLFKAWAKITLDDILLVTGVKLLEDTSKGEKDRYIRFPDRELSLHATGGEYVSIAVVNTNDEELRNHIIDTVFDAYDKHPKNPANRKRKEDNEDKKED